MLNERDEKRETRNDKLLLSVSEASKLCGLDDKKIADEIKSGRLKIFKLCGMINPKIPRYELEQWILNNTFQHSQIITR